MKITIVQGAFLPVPPLLGGAVEKVWFQLGKEFAKQGHQVTHISRAYEDLAKEEEIDGVKHIRVPGYTSSNNTLLLKGRDFLYSRRAVKALPPADILVTNTFFLPILVKGNSPFGKTYVHVARYPKGQLKFYKSAGRLQTVTHAIREAMREQAPHLEPLMGVVPYPVDLPSGETSSPPEKKPVVLYTGRVAPEKGLELLIKAFIHFRKAQPKGSWKLRIVGPYEESHGGGGRSYLAKLKELAQEESRNIIFNGPIFDKDQLALEYAQASLFCYPSLAEKGETFGLAPLEAMAHACPAIVSGLACFKDFVEDGKNGRIFDHRSSEPAVDIANILAEYSNAPDLARAHSKEAVATAQRFSYANVSQLYLEDFKKVLSS